MAWACETIRNGNRTRIRLQNPHLGHTVLRDPELQLRYAEDQEVVVDLEAVGFVWPFGLVFLEWYIRDLLARGAASVEIRVPSLDIGNYLVRMHVPDLFDGDPRVQFDVPRNRIRETERRDALIELQRFRVANDDDVEDLAQRFVHIIRSRTDEPTDYEPLFLTISEVLSNIEVHSGEKAGTLAVQRYGNRVCLAFGDAGVGIPNRLEGRYPAESEGQIIAHALEPQVSSRIGRGGMGLTELTELVRERTGRMTIHSAGGQVEVNRGGVSPRDGCCRIRGTLVEVELPLS